MRRSSSSALAIHGGAPLRARPLPARRQFGPEELERVREVFEASWECGWDFGYQGRFEEQYVRAFCDFLGGGHADAVNSGSAALLAALAALEIPAGGEVVFSPVTDPGGITPAIFLGLSPRLADSSPGSFNVGPAEFEAALTGRTKAAVITHLGGIPVDMDAVMEIARARGVAVVEDCSQAHGTLLRGKPVGTFGDIAVFSTMFGKTHSTGGCGGVVYTADRDLHWKARHMADRGKPFERPGFNPKDPGEFLGPGLNLNQDELSCAIGTSTLGKLPRTIEARMEIGLALNRGLAGMRAVRPLPWPAHVRPSLFFLGVGVDPGRLSVPKEEFARAVAAEGIWVNPDYRYVAAEWPWLAEHLPPGTTTPNASRFREESFNILFNERFTGNDVSDVLACVAKVDAALSK